MIIGASMRGRFPSGRAAPSRVEGKREEVIEAATRLFHEKGYHATTMEEVASQVGLRKASLYHYVGGKEDLVFQIMDRGVSTALKEMEEVYASNTSPVEKVRRVVQSLVEVVALQAERVPIFSQELRTLRIEQVEIIAYKRRRYEELLEQILEDGSRQGVFKVADSKIVGYALIGMCNWVRQWYKSGGRLSPGQIGQIFMDLALSGLLNTGAGGEVNAGYVEARTHETRPRAR